MEIIGTIVCLPLYTIYATTIAVNTLVIVPTAIIHATMQSIFFRSPKPATKSKEVEQLAERLERFGLNLEALVNNHPLVTAHCAAVNAAASAAASAAPATHVVPPASIADDVESGVESGEEEEPLFEVPEEPEEPEEDDANLTATEEDFEEEEKEG